MKLYLLLFLVLGGVGCSPNLASYADGFHPLISYEPPTSKRYAQGMDIYDRFVFQGYSDGTIDVYDIENCSLKQTIGPLLDNTGASLHMNDITFCTINGSNRLIIPGNNLNDAVLVFSLKNDNNEFIVEKDFSFLPPMMDKALYLASTQFFGNNNSFIQVAYKRTENNGFGDVKIECYSYETIATDFKCEKVWEVEHNKLWAMQGATIVDSFCYMAVGVPHGEAKIYRISMLNGEITCYKNFREEEDSLKEEEMQGIAYHNNHFYFSTTYGLYQLLK